MGDRGAVPNMFGANVSTACPPSSVASRHLPHPGEGFFWRCVALCGASQQWRSRLLAPRLGRGSLCGNGWWVRLIFGGLCRYDEVICSEMTQRVAGEWEEKQNAVSVSFTVLYFTPNKLRITPL